MPEPKETETEFGVAIPGRILPEGEWARTAIKRLPLEGPLDWKEIFGRDAPVVLELGCGNGRYTLLSALARPELNHLAVDALPVVIRYATRRANQRGLHHSRFIVKEAHAFIREYVKESSLAEVHLYHPQPYHHPGQAHLRLVTPRFLADVHRSLRSKGLFVIQTDNPDYWDYLSKMIPAFFEFREREGPWADAPEGRSRREILARSRGLKIFRGEAVSRDNLSREEAMALAGKLPPPTFRTRGPWCELDD